MIDNRKLESFKDAFKSSESVLIIYPNTSTRDQLLATTSLYANLKTNSEKSVKLLCTKDFSKDMTDVFYLDESLIEIGHENLSISLDYLEESIDKVSYHVSEETKKFYLTIKPKRGFPPLSKENIDFSYIGAEADLIILVGVDNLSSLGKLYFGYENLFNSASLVSFNSYETEYGNFKFDISGSSSYSEYISQILLELEFPIDPESATNLLTGISEATKNFNSYSATAETFEIVSKLMRVGARRVLQNNNIEKNTGNHGAKTSKPADKEHDSSELTGSFSPKEITDAQKREKERFRLKKIHSKNQK